MSCSKFPVAVIGMAVKLPGANSCEDFWELILSGRDTIGEFPPERAADIDHVLTPFRHLLIDENKPFFTGSFFKSVDKFDANLFQINPREAMFIEPEQRMFLEAVWELFEDAGYASKIRGSKTGVYVGHTVNKYKYILTENHPSISHGNHSPFISSRVSYTHDLQGPAMMVATGCSSSMLAVHIACQGLLSGDCEMAIAGGITLDLLPLSTKTDIWNQLGITGPNVKCCAFDAAASGIAKGEGCGVVLLKPLQKAIGDSDSIYGILEATTANQDGHSNGITAPHPGAQAKMLLQAWKLANISPEQLGYIEAHGTGTELGDPIEISGITAAFKQCGVTHLDTNSKIPIGSVKANIGHLADGAAGIVALIKALLCLQKNKIPPLINFCQPNPLINWNTAPVYVNTSVLDFNPHDDQSPRYISVSAFGLLGTNVHIVVKEYLQPVIPGQLLTTYTNEIQLLTMAANTRVSLTSFVAKLFQFFSTADHNMAQISLQDVCYSINTGREHVRFHHRAVVYADTWNGMMNSLQLLLKFLKGESSNNTQSDGFITNYDNRHQSIAAECPTLPSNSHEAIAMFLEGKSFALESLYTKEDKVHLRRVPCLPLYAFDKVRYWPKMGQPINKELLHLKHQDILVSDKHWNSSPLGDCRGPRLESAQSANVSDALQKALNSALNKEYDWNEMENDNLFTLGVDSLVCTQVSMKVRDEIGFSFSMTEFHDYPTYCGLKNLVQKKLDAASEHLSYIDLSLTAAKTNSPMKVNSLLQEALNAALGKTHDWQNLQHANLFTLGVDSLVYIHVSMKLSETLNLAAPLTLAELHNCPTYSGLLERVCARLSSTPGTSNLNDPSKSSINFKTNQFPLSFAQRRLWVMQQMTTNPCAYNATNCFKIAGNFHPDAFVYSADSVLSCHGVFFTVFSDGPHGPMQTHNWKLWVNVEQIDLLSVGSDAEKTVLKKYDEDYRAPFDLKHGPLVRCKLYRLPEGIYYFTMVIHCIIFDGWSHFLFYNELWDTYMSVCGGKVCQSTIHQPFYAELALEEQNDAACSGSKMQDDIEYWKKKLCGTLPLTTLPGDRRRPPFFTHSGGRITHFFAHDMIKGLEKFAVDKYTLFVVLLSAVYVLIYYYTGNEDLIVGTAIAGRTGQKSKNVIGCFVNTLALRLQLKKSYSFNTILDVVSKMFLEAYDHRQAPFDNLVSKLNLPRDTSITPVFSINVCYHNTEIKAEYVNPPGDVQVERVLLHNGSAKWDLCFDFLQEPEGLRFTLEYYSDVFSDTYAQCIVETFDYLLKVVSKWPHLPISKVDFVKPSSEYGCKPMLSLIHGPVKNLGWKSLAVLMLESLQVHATESNIIKRDGTKVLYGELLSKVERLSIFLREVCELHKNSRVGLLLDNCIQALESILACFLSGLIYVPLDPNSPKNRLEYMCKEAELEAVIFCKDYLPLANHLLWTHTSVKTLLCVDSKNFFELCEHTLQAPLMNVELWNCVAMNAMDDIEGGGWKSSYTGEVLSVQEMNEYAENVYNKLKRYLSPESSVLEIGCASGLTTFKICPFVDRYVATDLSQNMINKIEKKLHELGVSNVELACTPADQVGNLFKGQKFDVIIMNSVVHCFPGYNYLHRVISLCEGILSSSGILFIGDIMDLDLKENLIASLKSFKEAYPENRVKTEWHNELFLSRKFLHYVCASSATLKQVSCSRKYYTVPSELTEFRFDAIFFAYPCSDNIPQDNSGHLLHSTYAMEDITKAFESGFVNKSEKLTHWANSIESKDEAYVLYTSGTTGLPKGVIVSHEALLNYVTWASTAYKFDTDTVIPLFSPLTFDFTVTSIFPPLLSGSTICVHDKFQHSFQAMGSCRYITTFKLSPLQLDTILASAEEPLSASTFILGGEELTANLLKKLKNNKCNDNFVVWNEYGPTEATVGCIVRSYKDKELPLHHSDLVSIGHPIDNVTVAVVRDKTMPVPHGGMGTLGIGGKCLCSGIVGTKTSNMQQMFNAACWGRPGERMLLTDDIVTVTPDSHELVYFGRESDSSITKIHGFRIDLVEIQHAIEAHPLVHGAWVNSFAYENYTYLGAAVNINEVSCMQNEDDGCNHTWKQSLASFLAQSLPERCIPTVFVHLSDPPININGKKDVPLLQLLFGNELQANMEKHGMQGSMHPSTAIVYKLQRIWQSILPISHLPHLDEDFFFDLSGDSLQVIRLVRKMRDEGFSVSVTDIFQNSSIGKLIPVLRQTVDESLQHSEHTIEDERQPFRPTPIVEDYFIGTLSPKYPDYFSLSALLHFHGQFCLITQILMKALKSVMMKHISLRSKFVKSLGGIIQQAVELKLEPEVVEVHINKKQSNLLDETEFLELCYQLEKYHSLSEGVLLNACIINYHSTDSVTDTLCHTNSQTYVLLVVHHVAIDILSWQQVLKDLASALKYLNQDCDKTPVLQKCLCPFSVFCNALHEEASTGVFAIEVSYWNDVEKQCTDSGQLVKTGVRGKFKSAKWINRSIPSCTLCSISTKLACSDEQVLLTVLGRALSSVHGKNKTAICLEGHGRQLKFLNSTDTVGWCTNKFPFVLNVSVTGDLIEQVRIVSEMINKIPNRGLGYGLLRSAGKLKGSYPNIMFVFQGSLDASSKQSFDGGNFKFDHIPWIEVMLKEMKQGRFHRNVDEILEYDLEIVCWIYAGELKLGCLFDKTLISESVVEEIILNTYINLRMLANKTCNAMKSITAHIIPCFNITPDCLQTVQTSLLHHNISMSDMKVYLPDQVLQSLFISSDSVHVDITVIILRHKTEDQASEFIVAYRHANRTGNRKVVVIDAGSVPNSVRVPAKTFPAGHVVIQLPEFLPVKFYDEFSDEHYNMPFNQEGYTHLGLTMARSIRASIFDTKFKVIAVDADHTLWNGVCAEGKVTFSPGNKLLHKFLLKMKNQGILLVILSKNRKEDVVSVFMSEEMILKKYDFISIIANWDLKANNIIYVAQILNLSLDTFIFIDDSALECEEMIKCCPEVVTIQFPYSKEVVASLFDNLWLLDKYRVTSESANKTEIFRNEFFRQEELRKLANSGALNTWNANVLDLLSSWSMKLVVCKTTVSSLKYNKRLYDRASVLLHRTNQFKLNIENCDLGLRMEDSCWLVSLEDDRGSLGLISVILMSTSGNAVVINQWVISCRALGREVEWRILHEVQSMATSIQVAVNQTDRNIPAINFFSSVCINCQFYRHLTYVTVGDVHIPEAVENLHHVAMISDLIKFENLSTKTGNYFQHEFEAGTVENNIQLPSLELLNHWIMTDWSPLQKEQAIRHFMFPVIPKYGFLVNDQLKPIGDNIDHVENILKSTWMKVLKSGKVPEDNDDFLKVGGNSSDAVFLVSKVRRAAEIDINVMDLLQCPQYSHFRNVVLCAKRIVVDMEEKESLCCMEGCTPLSEAQRRVATMQQIAPHTTAYVETVTCRGCDSVVPTKVFKDLVKHHPILSARVEVDSEGQMVMTLNNEGLIFDVEYEEVKEPESIGNYLTKSIPEITVLSNPLVIFRILHTKKLMIVVVHLHHIIADEITLSNISHDLQRLTSNATLEPTSKPYVSFVRLEQKYLTSTQYNLDSVFWKNSFETLPSDVNLAILPEAESTWDDMIVYRAKHFSQSIPTDTIDEIAMFNSANMVTDFHYYLACASLILQRYLGVQEITIAIPVSVRNDIHEHADGLFVNTVLFRINTNPSNTIREHIKAIAKSWLFVQCHTQYPLDHLAKRVLQEHGKSISSFCCVLFNYVSRHGVYEELRVQSKHAKMPLSLDVIYDAKNRTTELLFEWSHGLVDDSLVERMACAVLCICSKAFKLADDKIFNIQLLPSVELDLLSSFNPVVEPLKECFPMHKTFEEYVAVNPHALAVLCNGSTITYGELNELACRIANGINQNIGEQMLRSSPIVMVMNKDEFVIASILGIWKVGGHFLPVSAHTVCYLQDIVKCCEPAAILYNISLDTLPEIKGMCPLLSLQDLLTNQEKATCDTSHIVTSCNDLAYIIRTSGSTGIPKVCKISHKNLRVVSDAWTDRYRISDVSPTVLQWAPLSFDVFIGDFVRALICAQGRLVLCPDQFRLDILYILDLIKQHSINLIEVTPQFGFQLVENAQSGEMDSIKLLILGSDVLRKHTYESVKKNLQQHQRVINSYGMTEATIDSSFFENDNIPNTRSGTVPIGKPLPGVTYHILDSRTLQVCPVGTVGELYISGDILASGDIAIIHLPHQDCLALKTGDAACWLPSGDVDLLGRLDSMIKLRGFRISTTEIESKIIQQVRGVKDCCVVSVSSNNEDTLGAQFLCAFVVLNKDIDPNIVTRSAVCNQLKLPHYMLPDAIHIVNKIPLTHHGKVDQKALPNFSQLLGVDNNNENVKSLSETVSTLKVLFSEALGMVESDGIHEEVSFMEQGGHSLILVQFASLIKQKTQFNIGIADIFSYPSIRSLADFIDGPRFAKCECPTEVRDIKSSNEKMAITGLGLRLPNGIMSLPQLWEVLEKGIDIVNNFPEGRKLDVLNCLPPYAAEFLSSTDTFQGVFLEHIDHFDHQFFKIPPGEAKFMSPEQRLFLQVATEALAEGRNLSNIEGSNIGVFVGNSEVGYSQLNHADEGTSVSGLMPGMIATRVAYQWDLKGPAMLVETACSSSLMALKLACDSIKCNECEGALVGGVSLTLYPAKKGVFGKASILSPDFRCCSFDKDANGTVTGEGVLCMYVEPLDTALKRNKHIYAVVKNISANSVGHGNGITAPSSSSQQEVVETALQGAGVQPSHVTFVESHGTGTKQGDRIELSALVSVFNEARGVKSLAIGSVKSIFGHTDSAAGLLGVFKVLASLMTKSIPPTAHFKVAHLELQNSSLYVPTKTIPWDTNTSGERIAGVSSFGLTGTNCHVIIAESRDIPNEKDAELSSDFIPLMFSGKSYKQIRKQTSLYKGYIQYSLPNADKLSFYELCLSVAERLKDLAALKLDQSHYQWRMVVVAKDAEHALKILNIIDSLEDSSDSLIQLAKLRNDIYLHCPQNEGMKSKCTVSSVKSFLEDNVFDHFTSEANQIKPPSGITIAMYDESRHWLDPTSQIIVETCTEFLIDHLHKKMVEVRETVRTLSLSPPKELTGLQNNFCGAVILKFFLSTNIAECLKKNEEMTFDDAFSKLGMLTKYKQLFFVMIRELMRSKLIIPTGQNDSIHCLDSFRFVCLHFLRTDPAEVANFAVEKYPPWADCFRFPLYVSKYFKDVLLGKLSPLSVIYPKGELNFMYQFDKLGDLLGDVYYNMYMQVITTYAKQLAGHGKQIRVLEVGAGVGLVTRQLLPKLKDTPNVEYWFTDLGKEFVEHAKTQFAEYQYMMRFCTFDITKNAPKQGLVDSYDIVVSYNVIHTTPSVMESVINLKSCLGDTGTLFIIESVKNETWATLAWGILDGWWFFKDYDLRPHEPMLEPDMWEKVLSQAGFASVYSCPIEGEERSHVKKFLFVCSAQKQHSTSVMSKLGWWETDIHRYNPIKKVDELEDEREKLAVEKTMVVVDRKVIYAELKNIWSELLGKDDINASDDFISLGGESLLVIQMMNLVQKRIGYQLEIADTFGYPTLGVLANFIANGIEELKKSFPVTTLPHDLSTTVTSCCSISSHGIARTPYVSPPETKILSHINADEGTLFMFPGQGAQKQGMCLSMKDSAAARAVFERAEKTLGYNILDICLNNNSEIEKMLKSTEFVEVALLVSCIAKVEQLIVERPELMKKVTHVSGLSVGELAALVYAGVIEFQDALKLVQLRGRAMEESVRKHATGMVSVFGPSCEQLQQFLNDNFPNMKISTYLADNQHTVAGTDKECEMLVESLSVKFKVAMQVIDVRKLQVACAFHSFYMEEAAEMVHPFIKCMQFTKPILPVIMNVSGEATEDPEEIRSLLYEQLVTPVKWKQTILFAYESGIRNFIEVSPKSVLSSIVKNRIRECNLCQVEYIVV